MGTKTISIMDFAGLWIDVSEKDAEKLLATVNKLRKGGRFAELKEYLNSSLLSL